MAGKEVYRDGRYVLGFEDGVPFITVNGDRYYLSCHPYEPCLYITGPDGTLSAVRSAFDPSAVLDAFSEGRTVRSITGTEYGADDFCRMIEYAAGKGVIRIDEAEKVFGGRAKKKYSGHADADQGKRSGKHVLKEPCADSGDFSVIEDDPFYGVIAGYPDCAVDWCLVGNGHYAHGYDAHRSALLCACLELFADEDGGDGWHFDIEKAEAKQVSPEEVFSLPDETGEVSGPVTDGGRRPYSLAFLMPPSGITYKSGDFRKVNAALFPNGTDGLEIFEWSADWSDYFDDGREWWGTLCLTVYDRTLDRFAVIMASATD